MTSPALPPLPITVLWTVGEQLLIQRYALAYGQQCQDAALEAAVNVIADQYLGGPSLTWDETTRLNKQVIAIRALKTTPPQGEPHPQASQVPAKDAWQPIDTMPRDGSSYLVADAAHGFVAPLIRGVIHNNPGTVSDWQYGEAITHWMPLPAPPHQSPKAAGDGTP